MFNKVTAYLGAIIIAIFSGPKGWNSDGWTVARCNGWKVVRRPWELMFWAAYARSYKGPLA